MYSIKIIFKDGSTEEIKDVATYEAHDGLFWINGNATEEEAQRYNSGIVFTILRMAWPIEDIRRIRVDTTWMFEKGKEKA